MNINVAKRFVLENMKIKHKFLYKGSRNQNEEFIGVITKMFPAIFIIELSNKTVKSFCYSDLLIGNLKIVEEK